MCQDTSTGAAFYGKMSRNAHQCWNITIFRCSATCCCGNRREQPDTDAAVRTYLGQIGGRKGDLSNFVERAVRERLGQVVQEMSASSRAGSGNLNDEFSAIVGAIRDRARSLSEAQVSKLVSEAVDSARGRG